ncbi:MAG: hypothetical protein KDB14_11730 [Planctomycetales bacterium]|nr:hypothetical protein [Planctomycetales bacterium]
MASIDGTRNQPASRIAILALLALVCLVASARGADPRADLILVEGAGGAPEFTEQFGQWSERWRQAAESSGVAVISIGGPRAAEDKQSPSDRDLLRQAIQRQLVPSERPLWIVLLGHGTDDRRDARFNLAGPDISAKELAGELKDCQRPLAVLCCFSASAPFLNELSGPGRMVVAATRSGAEHNFSRFGGYLAEAIGGDLTADLDKDGQTSLLEAFLLASKQTQDFYADENRLATEHALLDDNGDQRGTPADWFHGIRPVKSPKDGAMDGLLASRRVFVPGDSERDASPQFLADRDKLEQQISSLRQRKAELPEDDYYQQLEPLMLQLSKLYESLPQ